ncbi:MAG: trypsin-like peptidase domain-containing protein [Gammaproteobacteria bacterium]|nr:trypsin-like peptidase domain-containing protein [Gammaproteobacteria bacterium]
MSLHTLLAFTLKSAAIGILGAIFIIIMLPSTWQSLTLNTLSGADESRSRAISSSAGPYSYAAAVSRAAPAVVNIYTKKLLPGRRTLPSGSKEMKHFLRHRYNQAKDQQATKLGSGVIVNQQGHILTSNHVIENAAEIEVALKDGRRFRALAVGVDPETDLAVLKIEAPRLPSIRLAETQNLAVGDVVLAIGNPFGVGQTVTQGIISATGRNQVGVNVFENYIQTDAAINPGNSGGALINAYGDLIGINTLISSSNGGSVGIGFAVPVFLAKHVMTQLIENGRVIRGWIGVRVQDISAQLSESFALNGIHGVLVSGIVRGGPAHLASLYPGDIITSINNQAIEYQRQVLTKVITYKPGQALNIKGLRDGEPFELNIEVGERPIYGSKTY